MNIKKIVIIAILVIFLGLGCVGTEKVKAFSEKQIKLIGTVEIPVNDNYNQHIDIFYGNVTVDGKEVECIFAGSQLGYSNGLFAMDCKW
jgi:hypothetical protein